MTSKIIVPLLLFQFGLVGMVRAADQDVILNEVMYHPPAELEELQYVELFNRGSNTVNLANWSFTKGIQFKFEPGTSIRPGGFVVVARDAAALKKHYGALVAVGNFTGKLSHKKERIELVNSRGEVVDAMQYTDREDWPKGPDGYCASLERISPAGATDPAENWAPSQLPAFVSLGGTPGRTNDSHQANLAPQVRNISFSSLNPKPKETVQISCDIADTDGVEAVQILWHLAGRNSTATNKLELKRISGDAKSGRYQADLPGQGAGQLVRFVVQATDRTKSLRIFPHPNEPRPTCSLFYATNRSSPYVPQVVVLQTGPSESPGNYQGSSQRRNSSQNREPVRGNGALVYFPANREGWELYDHIRITPRKAGLKIRFLHDQELNDMSTVNLVREQSPRYVLNEHLAYEIYRLAGVPAPYSEHVRLTVNGPNAGLYLLIEQPNRSFLARNNRDTSGNLYKLLWYGNSVIDKHEKKTNLRTGHGDLTSLLEGLNRKGGAEQWEFIQKHFNVEEVINYFVVNMCIQNWDGFFNNYFVYHDLTGTRKWEIYPWDEDKTWGDYDGVSSAYDWYDMPLTYGMNGDRSPSTSRSKRGNNMEGPFGGVSWWRPPGHFSGPLLANPEFRRRFLARLKEVTEREFTEGKVLPIIEVMEKQLLPEFQGRSRHPGDRQEGAAQELKHYIQSYKNQLRERRRFILSQLK